jgi:hypothetical protein
VALFSECGGWIEYFHRLIHAFSAMILEILQLLPNTALEATPHSHCGLASECSDCLARWVRGASAFVR